MPIKPPRELRPLARVLGERGFTLAIPFDDVRLPGYIGTFNQLGQEIIVDDGRCLQKFVTSKKRSVVLGNTRRRSKFSLKGFLRVFGGLFGLNFEFHRAKRISIRFPKKFVPTRYITVMDIEEDWHKLSPACRRALTDPANFLIVQVLQTDSIIYEVEVGKRLNLDAKMELEKAISREARGGVFKANLDFRSDKKYVIEVKGKPMSIGYKRFRIGVPLEA